MKKTLLLLVLLVSASMAAYAQKGQVWPTINRTDMQFDEAGELTYESDAKDYNSYFLFIDNNSFVHCTETITSLYKILERDEQENYTDFIVVSEAENQYTFRFSFDEYAVVILSKDQTFGVYMEAMEPYESRALKALPEKK